MPIARSIDEARDQVQDLVERFGRNLDHYKRPDYLETRVRVEFVDPFFEALGWDVHNVRGYAEPYKDVVHEDAVRLGEAKGAPDYSFRIGGSRKFFLEAKKPAVAVRTDVGPAYQLRRYAWSARLPLSVLTDFEELALYDCQQRPAPRDGVAVGRVELIPFDRYLERFDQIYRILGRESVLQGSFDRYVQDTRAKRGTGQVDAEFLKEIEGWREALARNLALRNGGLSVHELNFAVQHTIDRILFLRIAEDRGIEIYGRLLALAGGRDIYPRLVSDLFRQADERYNSGLFDFQRDSLTPALSVDDRVLKPILTGLYYPESPYEFSVLPVEVLGQVYEQFLGKVIRLTPGHVAKVEEKPEVRKAGGVYYTPAYIVDYIVRQTVGRLVEGKGPRELRGARGGGHPQGVPLRVLDPACGSGSFLLGAYQFLLDHYRRWYEEHDPEEHARGREPAVYQRAQGDWRLTTAEKKRILLDHIYGVDIDRQAVEVTKLSLLLKVLEGESEETVRQQLAFWHERALPDLGNNVKCGNSLIGPDYFEGRLLPDEEELRRVNPFEWEREFPQVMAAGGFDVVIGNPPYGAHFSGEEASYLRKRYGTFQAVPDVYVSFIERSLARLADGGMLAFIVPSAWLGGPAYAPLRLLLLTHTIEAVVLLPFDVFAAAYIDTAIFALSKRKPPTDHRVRTHVYGKRERLGAIALTELDYSLVNQQEWAEADGGKFVLDPGALQLLAGIQARTSVTLGQFVDMKRGVLFDRKLLTTTRTTPLSFPYFEGDVYRYRLNLVADRWVEFGDQMRERPKELIWFQGTRLLLRRLVNRRQRLMAVLASETFITNKNLYSLLVREPGCSIAAVLGVLNSRLISFVYMRRVTQATKDDFPQVTIKDVLALPFPSAIEAARHDRMVALVEQMLDLHTRLAAAAIPEDRALYERQIEATDRQIDALVYELYGLTDEEIAIVEGVGAS